LLSAFLERAQISLTHLYGPAVRCKRFPRLG
jgi:hypothetical protein